MRQKQQNNNEKKEDNNKCWLYVYLYTLYGYFVGVVVVVVVALPLTVASDQIGSFVNMYLLNDTPYIQMLYMRHCAQKHTMYYISHQRSHGKTTISNEKSLANIAI